MPSRMAETAADMPQSYQIFKNDAQEIPDKTARHRLAADLLPEIWDLKIQIARPLADAVRGDQLTRQYYGRPPLLDTLLLPDDAERPRRKYLDWHREKVFVP